MEGQSGGTERSRRFLCLSWGAMVVAWAKEVAMGRLLERLQISRRLGAVSFVHLRIPGFQNSAWSIIYTLKILVESLNE